MLSSKIILSVGHDVGLLASRKLLFQEAGYHVISTARSSTAIGILRNRHVDVVVLCHSLTPQESEELAWTTKSAAPKIPVILLQKMGGPALSTAQTSKEPDDLPTAIQEVFFPRGRC